MLTLLYTYKTCYNRNNFEFRNGTTCGLDVVGTWLTPKIYILRSSCTYDCCAAVSKIAVAGVVLCAFRRVFRRERRQTFFLCAIFAIRRPRMYTQLELSSRRAVYCDPTSVQYISTSTRVEALRTEVQLCTVVDY